jgi:hypothetical protein
MNTLDSQGLTTQIPEPTVEAVVVRFFDVDTGKMIRGLSEPKIDPNHWRIHLDVRAYAPCRHAAHHGRMCRCRKRLVGQRVGPANLCTNVFANFVRANLLNTSTSIPDTGNTGRTILNSATSAVTMCAGTGGTAATVADVDLQTQTETETPVTVNAVSGSGSSGTFTVTATITAGADRAYQEVGLKLTAATFTFLVTHDTFSTLNVSSSGTLAVTYTFTNS